MLGALLFAASTFAPQGEPRLAGRVLDVDGRPVAAAEVTLLHRPIRRDLDPAAEHRLVVPTDKNGTFRAALREGRTYSAWSRSAAAASRAAEGVSAGDFVELREVAGTGPMVVKLEGLDAWPDAEKFTCRALVGSENLDFVALQRRGAELTVPALPPLAWRSFEVLDASGEVLWADRTAPGADGASLSVPPPVEYDVCVVDAAGAPVPGVEILAHVRNYWITDSDAVFWGDRFRALWPVRGRTDGEGRLKLRQPMSPDERDLRLLARKDGYGMSSDGHEDGRPYRAGKELPAEAATEGERRITIVLQKQEPVQAPLKAPGGAYGEAALYLVARVHIKNRDGGGTGIPFDLHLPVVDGVAALRSPLPPGTELELAWTHLAAAAAADLQSKCGMAPPVEFRLPNPEPLFGEKPPPQFDAQRYCQLLVIAADGRPAARTVVQLREDMQRPGRLERTDRLGRLLFERRGETRVSVFARDGVGGLSIAADAKEPQRLVLRAVRTVTGKIVDRDGKPVAGVSVSATIKGQEDGEIRAAEHWGTTALLRIDPSGPDGQFTLLLPPFAAEVSLDVPGAAVDGSEFSWDPAAPAPIVVTVETK